MRILFQTLAAILLIGFTAFADEKTVTPHPELAGLASFAGHSWEARGEGFHDIQHWRWVNGGAGIIIEHAVNGGVYQGVSLIHYDEALEKIVFRYATSDSFYTDGVITLTENGFNAHEMLSGKSGSISAVRSGYVLEGDEIEVWSQFEKEGAWGERTTSLYRRLK